MNGRYSPGDVVMGNWTLVRSIGEGSFGKVFEAEREDFGTVYKAAIKIITIPQSDSEVKSARVEGMDEDSVTAYFRSLVEEIVQEFVLMSKLKGHSNVVSYEDHTVIPHENGVGWDIIIRMELLTPLLDHIQSVRFTRQDVIRLGIDICKALELCQKYNIIHRDIKPENIFVSDLGDYKLGDFGIARTVEKTTGGLSKKGTYTYMAPEVYKDGRYNSNVDIYSLGIVLYRLLNENRAPFLPPYPAPITHSEREAAIAKRMSGAALPEPKNADGRLAEIVLKACAYLPMERYSSPGQMRQELEAILYDRSEAPDIYPNGDETPIRSIKNIPTGQSADLSAKQTEPASPEDDRTLLMKDADQPAAPKKAGHKRKAGRNGKKLPIVPIAAAAAAVVIGLFALLGGGGGKRANDPTPSKILDLTLAHIPDPANAGLEDPDAVKYYLVNEDSVNIGTPETFLDPQTVYENVAYGPEMFYNTYQLTGGDEAIARFAEGSDYFAFKEYDAIYDAYTTRDLTILPYKIMHRDPPNVPDADRCDWMRLYMRSWDGMMVTLDCAYTVEEDKLILCPIRETRYDKDSSTMYYEFSDVTLEYTYAFRGTALTLSRDGQSVTLNAGYISGTEEDARLRSVGYLAQGSEQIDDIIGFEFLWNGERYKNNCFYVIFEDRDGKKVTSYKCVGRMSEDGLFTFTVPYDQELPYQAEEKTYQFVYFFSGISDVQSGLILSDGIRLYHYTVSYSEYNGS